MLEIELRSEKKNNVHELIDGLYEIVDQLRKKILAAIEELPVKWCSYLKEATKKLSSFLKDFSSAAPLISIMVKLGRAQTVVWKDIPYTFIEKYTSVEDNAAMIQMFSDDIDVYDFLSADEPIKELLKDSFFSESYTFVQSIDAFERGDYCIAALGFTAVLDKYFSICYKNRTVVSINERANYLLDKIKEKELSSLSNEECNDLILCCTYSESIRTFGENSHFNKSEPKSLNRHWIMHGRYTRELTRFDCVRIIRILYGTVLINRIGDET